jgi:hypothetical protein
MLSTWKLTIGYSGGGGGTGEEGPRGALCTGFTLVDYKLVKYH